MSVPPAIPPDVWTPEDGRIYGFRGKRTDLTPNSDFIYTVRGAGQRAPAITAAAPPNGGVGILVVFTGAGFTGAHTVRFGSSTVVPASWALDSDTSLRALSPTGNTGTVNVQIENAAGIGVIPWTYDPPAEEGAPEE